MKAEGKKGLRRRFAASYVTERLARGTSRDLVELLQVLTSSLRYSYEHPDFGLPVEAFVFVEAQVWFAQSERSGAWTYYEATPPERQRALRQALFDQAPLPVALLYARGVTDWTQPVDWDEVARYCEPIDAWVRSNERLVFGWLADHARANATLFLELAA